MPHHYRESVALPAITMEDDLGIVYLVDNAQQFWSELEDILAISKEPTLEQLDRTLRRSLSLCTSYHEQYLQSPFQLEHACSMLLDSELFAFHSERMCDIVTTEAQSNTNPHFQLICFHVLLSFGRRRSDFFRSQKRWQPLLPFLMDHILVEIDSDVEDTYFGIAGGSNGPNVPVPIEAKLRSLSVRLLYEMCRVQKLAIQDLKVFDDPFLDYLFDLVEQTRHMQDDTFNYSVIKLIVALNEQFMVASLGDEGVPSAVPNATLHRPVSSSSAESKNRVLRMLMRRLGSSQTFGENMIFMLNRAQRTPEDLCMQLLVLKLLYLLFTNKGTEEYFYTNDLCVLVDVFLRELADLDDDNESLRHTYLRVLNPLLTKTQLRSVPYKRPQILYMLESFVRNSRVRDVNPTTKRLVERCLAGEWCVSLKQTRKDSAAEDDKDSESSWGGADTGVGAAGIDPAINRGTRSHLAVASSTTVNVSSSISNNAISSSSQAVHGNIKPRILKTSKSMEFKKERKNSVPGGSGSGGESLSSDILPQLPRSPRSPLFESVRRGSNASNISHNSAISLYGVASAAVSGQNQITQSVNTTSPTTATFSHSPPSSTQQPPAADGPDPRPIPPRRQSSASSAHVEGAFADRAERERHPRAFTQDYRDRPRGALGLGESLNSTLVLSSLSISPSSSSHMLSQPPQQQQTRRSAPPPPVQTKRRKPPAIPVGRSPPGNGNGVGSVTFTAIKSSNRGVGTGSVSSPLGR